MADGMPPHKSASFLKVAKDEIDSETEWERLF